MRTLWRRAPSGCSNGGRAARWVPSAAERGLPSSRAFLLAYGRAERRRSGARRSLAAATSFMARVIFCVDWTERIRRWMSRRVAMLGGLDPLGRRELGLRLGDGLGQRLPQRVADLPLVPHLGE